MALEAIRPLVAAERERLDLRKAGGSGVGARGAFQDLDPIVSRVRRARTYR